MPSAMTRYRNLSGDSGVRGYRIEPQAIAVEFADGSQYLYTAASAGAEVIERMQALASAGRGLATYINRHAHDAYAQKWT